MLFWGILSSLSEGRERIMSKELKKVQNLEEK